MVGTFTNDGLIRMGDARVDAIDDFAERTRHLHKLWADSSVIGV